MLPPEVGCPSQYSAPAAAEEPPFVPVFEEDFPDPFVLRSGSYWYAYATQGGLTQVPVMRSADLRTWEKRGDALRRLFSDLDGGDHGEDQDGCRGRKYQREKARQQP